MCLVDRVLHVVAPRCKCGSPAEAQCSRWRCRAGCAAGAAAAPTSGPASTLGPRRPAAARRRGSRTPGIARGGACAAAPQLWHAVCAVERHETCGVAPAVEWDVCAMLRCISMLTAGMSPCVVHIIGCHSPSEQRVIVPTPDAQVPTPRISSAPGRNAAANTADRSMHDGRRAGGSR